MILAEQLNCRHIAFPLISAGVHGFPKALALETALSAIRDYLTDSELEVMLVIFDPGVWEISGDLRERVETYLVETYLNDVYCAAAPNGIRYTDQLELFECDCAAKPVSESVFRRKASKRQKASLEDAVNQLGEPFQTYLLRLIDERGLTDPVVYKRANIDRKLFSKIRCHADYTPSKRTIIALAIALRLNLDQTKDLLKHAGLALSNNSKFDVIICFCLENQIYDVYTVNTLLFEYHEQTLN